MKPRDLLSETQTGKAGTRETGTGKGTQRFRANQKRHTQIDIESLVSGSATGNQEDLSATGQAQEHQQVQTDDHDTGQETACSNQELVLADSSSDTARILQTPVNDQASRRQVMYMPFTLYFIMLTSAGFDSAGSGDTAFYPHHVQGLGTRCLEDLS